MLFRTYTILRFLVTFSRYYDIRAIRVSYIFNNFSKMLGDRLSKLTTIRCMIINDPFKLLTIVTSVIIFTVAFSIRVIEGPLILIDNDGLDLSIPSNCIWLTLLTMTTVGYGDYYPKTNVGRAICVISSVIGSVLISFIIVALTNSLNFSDFEFRVRLYFKRHSNILKKIILSKK
jgi:potassium intermediate/small conductance calcium-activated channel subfamily N protein 2